MNHYIVLDLLFSNHSSGPNIAILLLLLELYASYFCLINHLLFFHCHLFKAALLENIGEILQGIDLEDGLLDKTKESRAMHEKINQSSIPTGKASAKESKGNS